MDYKTHNETGIDANGTHLQGHVTCDFDRLVSLFGEPMCWICDKTDWEWCIDLGNGHVATIYNWKNGFNYLGADGLHPSQINEWHVGGHDSNAMYRIIETLAAHREASQGGE